MAVEESNPREELLAVAGLPSVYVAKSVGFEREFLRELGRKIPHCDHIPTGIFHKPPSPHKTFSYSIKLLDYDDLNLALAKIFKRLRSQCRWIVKHTFSSSTYWIDLQTWDVSSGAAAWATLCMSRDDFENFYIVAEDLSFGMIGVVHGQQLIFFGQSLLDLVQKNRQLRPAFWTSN